MLLVHIMHLVYPSLKSSYIISRRRRYHIASHRIASLRFASPLPCAAGNMLARLPHPGPTCAPCGRDLRARPTCDLLCDFLHRIASPMSLCDYAKTRISKENSNIRNIIVLLPSASDHLRRIGQSFCIGCDIMIDFSSRTQCSKD